MATMSSVVSRLPVLRKIFPNTSYVQHKILKATYSSQDVLKTVESSEVPAASSTPSVASKTSGRDEGEEFRYLLRNSNFINMGDPEGKIVRGKIFQVVNNDLYIDFGWKFYCVCGRPTKGGDFYVRGAEVLLKVKSLELSSKFLGVEKGLTLLEAEASIIKLLSSPVKESLQF